MPDEYLKKKAVLLPFVVSCCNRTFLLRSIYYHMFNRTFLLQVLPFGSKNRIIKAAENLCAGSMKKGLPTLPCLQES